MRQRAKEILALTKMNWNSTEGIGRHPITISFARKLKVADDRASENRIPESFLSLLHVIVAAKGN